MENENKQLEALISELRAANTDVGFLESIKAKIEALLTERLAENLDSLSGSIKAADKNIGATLTNLKQELTKSIDEFRESSSKATRMTYALARFTKWLVIATLILAFLTGGLVFISYKQFEISKEALQAQIEPEMRLLVRHTDDGGTIILKNEGAFPIINIAVQPESTTFMERLDKKERPIVQIVRTESDRAWWSLDKLLPGETQSHSIKDVVDNEFKSEKLHKKMMKSSKVIPKNARGELHTLIHFRASFQREVDKRLYRKTKSVVLLTNSATGEPIIQDAKMMEFLIPSLRAVLDKLSDEEHLYR